MPTVRLPGRLRLFEMKRALLLTLLLVTLPATAIAGQSSSVDEDASLGAFVLAVEAALASGDPEVWKSLVSPNNHMETALAFFDHVAFGRVTRSVVRERDRLPLDGALPGEGFRLFTDVFLESGTRGRINTLRLDVRKPRGADDPQPWRILSQEVLTAVEGLHRLSLTTDPYYTATDLVITSVDLELRLTGDVFVVDTADGVTGVVLIGDGTMRFTPAPAEERGQVRLFARDESIQSPFNAAYLRFNPVEFEQRVKPQLQPGTRLDSRTLRRAQEVFGQEAGKSFSLDLRDLSRENWSLLPQPGDFLAEVRTRRFDTLTFARSTAEAEDVTLFHRAQGRNIAAYASEMKLSARGQFFDEDDLREYDVLDYTIDVAFTPEREWLDGRAQIKLRVQAFALAALTLKLADDFTVTSITADRLGRLMFLRVRNQNNVVVNLPAPLPRDTELTLHITYSGPIRTQSLDQESVEQGSSQGVQLRADELPYVPPEENWLFSNRSHWYPQNQVTDYATSTVRFSVPAGYKAIVSGIEAADSPVVLAAAVPGEADRVLYIYEAAQPARYLGAVVSRFEVADRAAVALDVEGPRNSVTLTIEANRRQVDRGRELLPTAAEIFQFYAALVGAVPFEAMTIAMVEHERPGGHSPAYFAVLNNPPPIRTYSHRHDPAAFSNFPEFFIAHEIAHQWWGQAVGWKNYHEQWLSEGFAQYFAALYAQQRRGEDTFRDILKQFRRWAMDQSDQGAVYLGYRLGHIKGDSRVFRAIAYNKGAAVLHMLRRWLGDDAFFRGLRRYYSENQFRKAGTDDFRRAMEAESDVPLERFFERWVYESGLPRVRYSSSVQGQELVVRFEQAGNDVYDVPVTVSIRYADRTVEEVVTLTEALVEKRFPLAGNLRGVEINHDDGALGHFNRR